MGIMQARKFHVGFVRTRMQMFFSFFCYKLLAGRVCMELQEFVVAVFF
jgi:hypothetical protein